MSSTYFRVTDLSATSPVILHAPHGGQLIPTEHLPAYVISSAELEAEKMNAVGMGVLYTHGSHGQEIRDLARTDQTALMHHFKSYSAALTDLVNATLRQHGRALIIDMHSYPEHALAYELHADRPRPELCIGFEQFHAPADFVHTVTDAFAHLHALPNGPFAGAYVPLEHYGTDSRVNAVMLEIRRDLYMDEDTLALKPAPFRELQESLQKLVNTLAGEPQ
ncbi:N-formylglutamate amidohydrolase [Cryobacterium psychrophilum]|nr:N-formylglutamate amidohydrolase [Cryobacterium psychrophilum]TDW31110.1 N-formylglutamate amidohydrolase [Cryobacterium psychrophilum]